MTIVVPSGYPQIRSTQGRGAASRPRTTGTGVCWAKEEAACGCQANRLMAEGRPAGVLLVEDNQVNQAVAIAILTRLGYRADVADNGQLAVALMAQRRYGLVLMDCQLPVLDGYQATIEIRRREATAAHTPIVAMTGAVLEDRERCLAAGMDDHIAKPVLLAEVRDVLARWLPGGDATHEATRSAVAPASTGEVLDQRRLAELRGLDATGNGPALVGRLLECFLAWIPVDLADLRAALDHGEAAQALRVTHRLKGAAGTVGSSGMVSLCEQLELHVRGEALSPAADLLPLLEQEFNRVIRALDAIVPKR